MATDVVSGIMVHCWRERPPCPECGHGSYLYGCTCEAQNCICRKRRTLNEQQQNERALLPALSQMGYPLAALVPVVDWVRGV